MKKYSKIALVVILVLGGMMYGVYRYVFPQTDLESVMLLPVFVKFDPVINPDMVSPEQATWLKPDDLVLGVEQNGDAHAYPLVQVQYHHTVNDMVGGEPYLGTY